MPLKQHHKTKIICSLDHHAMSQDIARSIASRRDLAALRLLYDSDKRDLILSFIKQIYSFQESAFSRIPIMIDLGAVPRGYVELVDPHNEFHYEQVISITKGGGGGDIEICAADWPSLFALEKSVFFGFARLECVVMSIQDETVKAKVVTGGTLVAGTAVHVPATRKPPSIFDKEYIDIGPFQQLDVDYLVLPGLSRACEVASLKKELAVHPNGCPSLLMLVDHLDVYTHVGTLLAEADGVVISRRDLALTMEAATVPMVCKEIIRDCNESAKLAIISSDILGSLQYGPTPTRAEVSDLANAVIDGTDAIMLSEEIAHGKHLMRSLSLCRDIILDVEHHAGVQVNWKKEALAIDSEFDAVAFHAFKTSQRIQAKAIVCITCEGNTALRLASFRTTVPIIAVTFQKKVERKLSLVRGVHSMVLDMNPNLDEVLPVVNKQLKSLEWLQSGDKIVFVTVTLSPVGRESSNLFTIQSLDGVQ